MQKTQFCKHAMLAIAGLFLLALLGGPLALQAQAEPEFRNLKGPEKIEFGETYTYSVRVAGKYDKDDIAWSATGGKVIKHYWEGANYFCKVRWQENDPDDPAKIKVYEKDSSNDKRLYVEEATSRSIDSDTEYLLLDANGGRNKPYLNEDSDDNNNFLWTLKKKGDYVMLIPKVKKVALDANGGDGEPYFNGDVDSDNDNLLWKRKKKGDYVMFIPKVNTDAALDANGGEGNPYLNPEKDSDNANHLWLLEKNGDYYKIYSKVK